jgi:putative addiction module component (TIGR02574 family)
MNTETLERLRAQISTLLASDRAALARDIIISLDGAPDDAMEEAWDEEITRRIAQVETGQAHLLTREEFRRQMHGRIGNG